jgi:hypothetical protein
MDWIDMAQGRGQLRALFQQSIEPLVSMKRWEILKHQSKYTWSSTYDLCDLRPAALTTTTKNNNLIIKQGCATKDSQTQVRRHIDDERPD